jgi:hypothetical protein
LSPHHAVAAAERARVHFHSYLLVFCVAAIFLVLAHGPLLDLPYYWDEIGQFIPAALDIFHHAAWIPLSTVPNVHPPTVMAYLAGVWMVFGYSVEATRIAMLIVAALGVLFVFLLAIELSRGSAGTPAFAAVTLFCLSPLFFAQSMLAQLDMPAMVAATLALLLFLQNRFRDSALACAALVLIKETGLVVPALFFVWLVAERRWGKALWFLLPLPGLAAWLFFLHRATGYWLGNPAFEHYNIEAQLTFARVALALLRRFYYLFIGSGHFIGAAVVIYAYGRMPLLRDRAWKIAAAFVLVQAVTVSLVGGAVLERYLLPALPVLYTAFAVAMQALRTPSRRLALGALFLCLAATSFVNPVYPFPFENNLAFVDFVDLEKAAAAAIDGRPVLTVATVFPVADALTNPEFGYVTTAHHVTVMPDFSSTSINRLSANPPDLMIVFDRTWDPIRLLRIPAVREFLIRHYSYVPEMPPAEIARTLSMRIARRWTRRGMSMELLLR